MDRRYHLGDTAQRRTKSCPVDLARRCPPSSEAYRLGLGVSATEPAAASHLIGVLDVAVESPRDALEHVV
jgi:hypothetical protein